MRDVSAERWDEPSEKLKRLAVAAIAPEPEIRPLTRAEKERLVGRTTVARDIFVQVDD